MNYIPIYSTIDVYFGSCKEWASAWNKPPAQYRNKYNNTAYCNSHHICIRNAKLTASVCLCVCSAVCIHCEWHTHYKTQKPYTSLYQLLWTLPSSDCHNITNVLSGKRYEDRVRKRERESSWNKFTDNFDCHFLLLRNWHQKNSLVILSFPNVRYKLHLLNSFSNSFIYSLSSLCSVSLCRLHLVRVCLTMLMFRAIRKILEYQCIFLHFHLLSQSCTALNSQSTQIFG